MFIIKNFLLFLILRICSTYGWDLAVSSPGRILLANLSGEVERIIEHSALSLGARGLAMDLRHRVLYFTGAENGSSVFSVSLDTQHNTSALVVSRPDEHIQNVVFDPMENKLYWTDNNIKAIFWSQISTNSQKPADSQTLLSFTADEPQGLALDHCRRLLFWTNVNHATPSIDRLPLGSSHPEKIITTNLVQPLGLVVDPTGRGRLYWGHDLQGIKFAIETCRLDGTDRRQMLIGRHHTPFSLAKVGDTLLWSDWTHSAVWSFNISTPKDQRKEHKILQFNNEVPYSVLAYPTSNACLTVDDQAPLEITTPSTTVVTTPEMTSTEVIKVIIDNTGVTERSTHITEEQTTRAYSTSNDPITVTVSSATASTSSKPVTAVNTTTTTTTQDPLEYMNIEHLYCLAGGKYQGHEVCECPEGFAGSRCEQNLCLNFCLHGGTCTPGMPPTCQCQIGYSGARCEVEVCHAYCLNGGVCQVLPDGEAKCKCDKRYYGLRCEIQRDDIDQNCNCSMSNASCQCHNLSTASSNVISSDPLYSNDSSSQITGNFTYILISLGSACLVLLIVVGALTWHVIVLKKQPRIRRRVIVSRKEMSVPAGHSGEPGSGRRTVRHGDTCEITIENCCNMNICETPCFEPPVRTSTKRAKKEEKKTLLANMEDPDSPAEN